MNSKTYTFLLTLFILSCLQKVWTQNIIVQTQFYGTEDGLSHRHINYIHQDKSGILWLGTKYGLNRFDGYNFRWFTKETHGLQSNRVNHLFEDKHNNVWLIDNSDLTSRTIQSIDVFDPLSETSTPFAHHFENKAPFEFRDVIMHASNNKGQFAFLTKDKKLIFYEDDFNVFTLDFNYQASQSGMSWAPNNIIWFYYALPQPEQGMTLVAYNTNGEKLAEFNHSNANEIRIYDFDDQGNCLYTIHYYKKLNGKSVAMKANLKEKKASAKAVDFFPPELKNQYLFKIRRHKVDQHNLYFVCTEHQLDVFNPSAKNKYKPIAKFEMPYIDKSYQTPDGKVWIATAFGLHQLKISQNKFNRLMFNDDESPRGKNGMRQMTTDSKGNLWVVVEGKRDLWKIDKKTKEISTLNTITKHQEQFELNFPTMVVNRLSDDRIWLQTELGKFGAFNPKDLTYKEFVLSKSETEKFTFLWCIYEDDQGRVWFTTDHGDIGIQQNNQTIWLPDFDIPNSPDYIYHFHKDQRDNFWMASESGLFNLDNQTGALNKRYWSDGTKEDYVPFDLVYHFHEDADGSFWLGTGGTGLVHWNQGDPLPGTENDPVFYEQFSREHGLNNVIYAVYEDDHDNLWMPSDNGIIRFNKSTRQIKTYLEKDGITHHEFNRISHLQTEDGTLYFGGLNGITSFHPDHFIQDNSSANFPLVITDFQQFDKSGQQIAPNGKKIKTQHAITFHPDDRFIRIEFALLNFEEVEKNLYAYKLEGQDNDWIYQRENFVRYAGLPYGKHKLRIKGQSADGQWSNHELAIDIHVLKPFYLQNWFLIASALTLFMLLFLFYKTRTKRLIKRAKRLEQEVIKRTDTIRQQAEELKSLEQLKSRFFSNVSHELRTPLTLMFGPVNKMIQTISPKDQNYQLLQFMQRNTRHLLKLVNEILDLSKLENNKLDIVEEVVLFYSYLKNQIAQFHSFAASKELAFAMDYQIDRELYLMIDKNKFEKIIHNFLSNAMKYTPKGGEVSMIVTEEDGDQIKIEVRDNGQGIHPDDLPYVFDRYYQSKRKDAKTEGGTGIGLSLCNELAMLLGGKVWVNSELGLGSSFYFSFFKKVIPFEAIADNQTYTRVNHQNNDFFDLAIPVLGDSSEVSASQKTSSVSEKEKSTILIVEDNTDLQLYYKTFLSEYNIVTTENGQVAWDWLQSNQTAQQLPDIIISDLMMPVMDGLELLEKIKSSKNFAHLPMIMLTAKANIRTKLNALRIGVDDYLLKPFQEEELKARIENLLHNYKERMRFFSDNNNGVDQKTQQPAMAQVDSAWLIQVETFYQKHLTDSRLNTDFIAEHLLISTRQFRRKLKALTGLTPNQYLQEMRLQIAYDYLLQGQFSTIKEVSYAVGFNDTRYFSTLFRKRFGTLPSDIER